MDLLALIAEYGPWSWIIAGLILLGVELVAPGGVLVWLGVSAIIVGLASLVQPLGWPLQWLLYGVLSIVSLLAWLNISRRRKAESSDKPHLNERGSALVGRQGILKDAISGGEGRMVIGDSIWRVRGADLPEGASVRVIGSDGAVLLVESAD